MKTSNTGAYDYRKIRENLEMKELNVLDSLKHLSEEEIQKIHDESRLNFSVCALNLTGDLNIGFIVRSACLIGAEKVYVMGRKKFDRRGMVGAQNRMHMEFIKNFKEDDFDIDWDQFYELFDREGMSPIAIENGGTPIRRFDFTQYDHPCLVMGNENMGIPEHVTEKIPVATIPQRGVMRSLNVGASCSIAMNEVAHQLADY